MNNLSGLIPLFLLVFIMYFILIRPQKKKEKQINAMRSSVKVGDDIITIGGIYGKVTRVKDESLTIQVGADKTRMEITRWAVSKMVDEGADPKAGRTRAAEEEHEAAEPVKKAPRKRLEKAPKSEMPEEPVEPNPLESDSDSTPLE